MNNKVIEFKPRRIKKICIEYLKLLQTHGKEKAMGYIKSNIKDQADLELASETIKELRRRGR